MTEQRTRYAVHYRCTKCGHDWPESDPIGAEGHGHVLQKRWGDLVDDGFCEGPIEELERLAVPV